MKKYKRFERHAHADTHPFVEFLKRFGFVLLVALLFLMLTFTTSFSQKRGNKDPADPAKEAAIKISLGDDYLQKGNGGMAVSSYEDAATLNPKDASPHYKIGIVYLRSTNKDAATESFKKALEVDPNYAPAYKELAELYYIQKNGPEAVKAQQKYIQLGGSDNGNEIVRLGYYFFMAKDFTKTNEVFAQAYEKGLLKDIGLRYYARSLVEGDDFVNGKKVFEEYLTKAEGEAADYASYGKALVQLKEDSLAAIALEKSLSLDNRQTPVKKMLWETLYSLGKQYYSDKQFALADTTFEKLIGIHPGVVTGYLWAARANANLDPETEKGLAKNFYEKVVEIGEVSPDKSKSDLKEAYSYLGYYYLVKEDKTQSKVNWEKVLSIDPKDENALKALKLIK